MLRQKVGNQEQTDAGRGIRTLYEFQDLKICVLQIFYFCLISNLNQEFGLETRALMRMYLVHVHIYRIDLVLMPITKEHKEARALTKLK